jgi:IS30 family transposase
VAGVLSNEEAVLIARTRVEGESLRCLARDLGRPYDAVRMERRRAEAALRSYASSLRASS